MKVAAVLFDLFDTLVIIENDETFYIPCLRKLHEFLVKNGINVSFEDFKRVYFEVRDKLYMETEKSLEEPHFNVRVMLTLQRLGYNFDVSDSVVVGATMAFGDELLHYIRLDEDAIGVLRRLYGRYKLGIVSNFAIPEIVWELLEKFDLEKFFDTILISGEINRRKPSPEIFEKALKALGVDASQAVFVGDTPRLDVKGARDVGMRAILIERKASATDKPDLYVWKPAQDEQYPEPDKAVRSLSELLVVLEDCWIDE